MLPEIARRPALWAALPVLLLMVGLVFGKGGLVDLRSLAGERDQLAEAIFSRIQTNAGLRRQIHVLSTSDRELEKLARQELGFVREDEIVYRFRKAPSSETSSLARSNRQRPTGS